MDYTGLQYAKDVKKGKIKAGKFLKYAVERFFNDIERSKANTNDFPYFLDIERANKYITFAQLLKHSKGEWAKQGLNIKLEPWQQFIFLNIFGWVRKDTKLRRFSEAYIEVARKNGKTTLAACLASAMLVLDMEAGAEIYCVATKKDQAKICWSEIYNQLKKTPAIFKKCKGFNINNSSARLVYKDSFVKPLGQDSKTEDGLNPYLAIIDEFHAHITNEMVEIVKSGMGARLQPLIFIITTAGTNLAGPCYKESRELAKEILFNKKENSDKVFTLLYELDEEDDWTDINNAVKANPNLGISVYPNYIQDRIEEALNIPSRQSIILTKNFNKWVSSETTWIPHEKWDVLKRDFNFDSMRGRRCYVGMDLSGTIDLSVASFTFPAIDLEKEHYVIPRFYMPKNIVEAKSIKDHVPYASWADRDFIKLTEGDTVDQRIIEEDIKRLEKEYDLEIVKIAYDPWNASQIVRNLDDDGYEMVEFRQGYRTISPCAKIFEKLIIDKKIVHDGNPILAWNIDCTELEIDPAGNIKPSKKKLHGTSKRIDGVIATIMSLGLFVVNGEEDDADKGNVYVL